MNLAKTTFRKSPSFALDAYYGRCLEKNSYYAAVAISMPDFRGGLRRHNAYIGYATRICIRLFSTVGYVIEGCFIVAKKTRKEDTIEEPKVTDHVLVPKHEILQGEEKKQIVAQYNATEDQFPFLFATDPVVREIGAKPGDMVKITRVSDTAGQTTYYRYVVEAV